MHTYSWAPQPRRLALTARQPLAARPLLLASAARWTSAQCRTTVLHQHQHHAAVSPAAAAADSSATESAAPAAAAPAAAATAPMSTEEMLRMQLQMQLQLQAQMQTQMQAQMQQMVDMQQQYTQAMQQMQQQMQALQQQMQVQPPPPPPQQQQQQQLLPTSDPAADADAASTTPPEQQQPQPTGQAPATTVADADAGAAPTAAPTAAAVQEGQLSLTPVQHSAPAVVEPPADSLESVHVPAGSTQTAAAAAAAAAGEAAAATQEDAAAETQSDLERNTAAAAAAGQGGEPVKPDADETAAQPAAAAAASKLLASGKGSKPQHKLPQQKQLLPSAAAAPAASGSIGSSSDIRIQLQRVQAMNAAVAQLLQGKVPLEQQQQQQPPQDAAAAAAAGSSPAPSAAAAAGSPVTFAVTSAATPAAASKEARTGAPSGPSKPAAAAARSSSSSSRPDPLLLRIENSRSARELQQLFERQQQRMRSHHLAALVTRLPHTNEGRRAIQELEAAAAAAAAGPEAAATSSSGSSAAAASAKEAAAAAAAAASGSEGGRLSGSSKALLGFADDLLTMLQLQLNQLNSARLAGLAQAAADLQLSPRPAWLSSFLAASQPKLQHLDAQQLASVATAVAALSSTAAAASASTAVGPGSKPTGQNPQPQQRQQQQQVKVAGGWVKTWLSCSKQQLQQLQVAIRQHEQQKQQQQQADKEQALERSQEQRETGSSSTTSSSSSLGASIGRLAVAAVQLGALSTPAAAAAADNATAAAAVRSPGPGPTAADRLEWLAALAAAAATAAAAVSSRALDAAAASQVLYALTVQQQQQPGLLLQLDQYYQQQQSSGSNGSSVSYVRSVVAALAAAAGDTLCGSQPEVLLRLIHALMVFGVQPGDVWLSQMCAALSRQMRRLATPDCLAAVEAFSRWCDTRSSNNSNQQQEQKQQQEQDRQQQEEGEEDEELEAALHRLSSGLLIQLSRQPQHSSALQLCAAISSVALYMGYTFKVKSPAKTSAQQVQDAAALEALKALLHELSHNQALADVPTRQVLALLQGLNRMGVSPDQAFVAAVQRDAFQPRLKVLKPREFAAAAEALAGLGVQMDREVLEGYWQELADQQLDQLTDADSVAVLCAVGALRQKPRAQHLGAFLAHVMPRLGALSREQLVECVSAMAQLQLTRTDTQGIRATTAQSAPAPSDFIQQLLQHLSTQLPGPQGATAPQLTTVLQSLVKLGCSSIDQAWLTTALEGAAEKLALAVATPSSSGAEQQVLVNLLSALGQIWVKTSVKAPDGLLTEALTQLKAVLDHLDATQIATAMTALRQLQLDPDDSLMQGYLDRAAAAAADGTAAAQDMAAVLQSVAAAAAVPPAGWLQRYLQAVQQQLQAADSDSLAGICHAAAALYLAGQQHSSSSGGSGSGSSYEPDASFVKELVAVATSRIGSSYMDAARILASPDYKAPFSLSGLADCCWGLLKLGAEPSAVQGLISMLISKSYDRLTQLSGPQLAGAAWAIAACNNAAAAAGSSGSSRQRGSSSSSGIKLPGKWLNQLATAAAADVRTLSPSQLSDLIWALGSLYLGADHYAAASSGSSGSSDPSSSSSGSSAAAAVTVGSSIGSSSAEPVQQLLKAVAAQLNAQPSELTAADDVSTLVNLLAKFECTASSRLLQRFCADVAASWPKLSDAAVADAAAAVAVLVGPVGSSGSSGRSAAVGQEWLEELSQQMLDRLPGMEPPLRCKCIWALATLAHSPGHSWLTAFASLAFEPSEIAKLQPGDLSDAVWGLYTLEALSQPPQPSLQPPEAEEPAAAAASPAAAAAAGSLLTEELMQQLHRKLEKRVHELQPPQVVRLMRLAEAAMERVQGYRLPRGIGEQMSLALSAKATSIGDTAGVLSLAWAAANLELPLHGSAVDHICRKMYGQLQGLSASEMARGFWASAKLRYGWLPPQLEEFDRQSQHKLSEMTGSDVSLLLEAFKTYGYAPSREWLQQFAGMPASSLSNLSTVEVLQLAVQLSDDKVGLPASRILWLLDWAEGGALNAVNIQGLTGQQLFDLLQLLAAATAAGGSTGVTQQQQQRKPSSTLLALLCWAVAGHVAVASGQQVYCLVKALADWQYKPPNGDELLAAAATRVADKLPMLTQLQLSEILCGFATLGFSVGEPLQSKICARLLQATTAAAAAGSNGGSSSSSSSSSNRAASMLSGMPGQSAAAQQAGPTGQVLAAVLMTLQNPAPGLVPALMQQLDGKLHKLPRDVLLQLGQGLAASGMRLQLLQQQQPPAAAVAAAGGGGSSSSNSSEKVIATEWGRQYLAAAASCFYGMQVDELAAACRSLQQIGLPADATAAEAVVQALQQHLNATTAAGAAAAADSINADVLTPIACYITDSGFRPTAQVMEAVEQQLLVMLTSRDENEWVMVASSSSNEYEGQQQQQQERPRLLPSELGKLLLVLNRWGRRPGSSFTTAAFDWSRQRLVDCDISTLGPLLLGLGCVCGKPSEGWMLDWAAVTSAQLSTPQHSSAQVQDTSPADLATLAVALAQSGGAAKWISSSWWAGFSQAVLEQLTGFSNVELENLGSSLYRLEHRPSKEWREKVLSEVQRRVPDSGQDTPAARALAWLRQLRAAN